MKVSGWVSDSRQPSLSYAGSTVNPGVPDGTMIVDTSALQSASVPVRADTVTHEVIGVLPATFAFLRTKPGVVLPLPLDANAPRGISFGFQALARLKPGVTLPQRAAVG